VVAHQRQQHLSRHASAEQLAADPDRYSGDRASVGLLDHGPAHIRVRRTRRVAVQTRALAPKN